MILYNPNPLHKCVGDCVVRALSKALEQDWERTYIELCLQGFMMCDMPSSNAVWGAYLKGKGFRRNVIPNECSDCYTVQDFCNEHPNGRYILALSGHVIAVVDGDSYDTWNSVNENPIYFWERKENE